eukprot:NODE_1460_length_965_cov_497.510917_g1009_i0.p1 GENE.NODE_1460_length_965_cov_497.510917_g1009_i0~~NODE_1460_length_965_cov_497.510917_g1009_i0.p1  ORF type:complete len:144 (+),score=64.52 NODE_1460_length_965_cov_497.510917_g1009_i0:73-504(+)
METALPTLKEAEDFAHGVHAMYPDQWLAYNCSPSFNWDSAGMTDEQIQSFQTDIARLGYVWQFITLAGFHMDALMADRFAMDYSKRYMLAYVQSIQRPERKEGVETLTHQKWSGANYMDAHLNLITPLSSTNAQSGGSTEKQF